jgi:hypothetical protein
MYDNLFKSDLYSSISQKELVTMSNLKENGKLP